MVEREINAIHSTPTSFHTAELSEIVLSETERTKTVFQPIHVDNPHDREKQLKGTFVFQKPKRVAEEVKLSRRDIRAGEYVELSLDTSETHNLAVGLAQYIDVTAKRMTPVWVEKYVPKENNIANEEVIAALRARPELLSLLTQRDIDVLTVAGHVRELQEVRAQIADNLTNADEHFWQELFETHSWVLAQVFALPYMCFVNQPYVGGKGIRGNHGKFPDFLYKNRITGNVAIVEIKTPTTALLNNTVYRDEIFSVHKDASGAVAQILNQRETLYKQYSSLVAEAEDEDRFEALNIQSILVIGVTTSLDSKAKKRSFERYRNELRNVDIICFDELLQKIDTMLQLMTAEVPE